MSQIEHGKIHLTIATLKLAWHLDLSISALLKGIL